VGLDLKGREDDERGIQTQAVVLSYKLEILEKFGSQRLNGFEPVSQRIDIFAAIFDPVIQMRTAHFA
jgi:hypothetical protein